MLNSFDFGIAISLAICYNLFSHCLASTLYGSKDYLDKYNYTIVTLMLLGIIALVLSKIISKKVGTYVDSLFSMSLGISGALLIMTTILIDWHNLNELTQVIIIGIMTICVSYYVYLFC